MLTQETKPFAIEIVSANVNLLQFGFFSAFLYLRQKDTVWRNIVSGAILSVLFFFKPNFIYALLLLFVYWGSRANRATFKEVGIGFIGMAALIYLGTALFYGSFSIWNDWFHYLNRFSMKGIYVKKSLLSRLGAKFDMSVFYGLTGMAFSGILALMTILNNQSKRGLRSFEEEYIYANLGVIIYLLTSHFVHYHYFLLTIPALIYLLKYPENLKTRVFINWLPFFIAVVYFLILNQHFSLLSYIGLFLVGGFLLYELKYVKTPRFLYANNEPAV